MIPKRTQKMIHKNAGSLMSDDLCQMTYTGSLKEGTDYEKS